MLKLRKTRRTVAMATAAVALASGVTLATGGAAFADSGSVDLSTPNCYSTAYWTDNQMWGTVSSKNGTYCVVTITQNGGSARSYGTTGGTNTTMKYWLGYSSAGPYLHDTLCSYDRGVGWGYCYGR